MQQVLFVQRDCSVYCSAGNLQGSQLLFLSLHVWRYSDEESVKEKWDFGTGWNLCKMKILMKLVPLVKVTYLEIFLFSVNLIRKPNQNDLKMCLILDLDNLHHLGRGVSFREAADHPTVFTKVSVPPQVFLWFIIGQVFPNFKTHQICTFLKF